MLTLLKFQKNILLFFFACLKVVYWSNLQFKNVVQFCCQIFVGKAMSYKLRVGQSLIGLLLHLQVLNLAEKSDQRQAFTSAWSLSVTENSFMT
jgi:hypothetical protein